MSGGSFNYVYFDVENAARTMEEVADYVEDDEEIPDAVAQHIGSLADTMLDNAELLRAIEWHKSGDSKTEAVMEEYGNLTHAEEIHEGWEGFTDGEGPELV